MILVWIKNDNIGIAANCNGSFAGKHSKNLCRIGTGHLNILVQSDSSLIYSLTVQKLHPVFNGWVAIRNFRKIFFTHFLLLPHEWTMIGGYNLHQALIDPR